MLDAAAMTSARRRSRSTRPTRRSRSSTCSPTRTPHWSPRRSFWTRSILPGEPGVEHLLVVDGTARGTLSHDVEPPDGEDFDFEATWRAVEPDDVAHPHLHDRYHRPAEGRADHARQLSRPSRAVHAIVEFPDGGRRRVVAPDGAYRGAQVHALPADVRSASRPRAARTRARSSPTCPTCGPTWFFAVPRIFEKLKAAIEAGVEAEQDEEKKQATNWAIDVGARRKVEQEQAGEEIPRLAEGAREGRCARPARRSDNARLRSDRAA